MPPSKSGIDLSSNTAGGLPVPGRQRVEAPVDRCGDANFWKEIALRDLDGRLGRVGLIQCRQNGGVRAQRNGCRLFQSGQRNMIERGGRDERHRLGTSQLPIDCRAFGKPCSGDGALDGRVGNAHAGLADVGDCCIAKIVARLHQAQLFLCEGQNGAIVAAKLLIAQHIL